MINIWKDKVKADFDMKLDEKQTPCILKEEDDLDSWIIREEDVSDYKSWMPLVSYINGIRWCVVYRNVKVGDPKFEHFKKLIVYINPGTPDFTDYDTIEEGLKCYNSAVETAKHFT